MSFEDPLLSVSLSCPLAPIPNVPCFSSAIRPTWNEIAYFLSIITLSVIIKQLWLGCRNIIKTSRISYICLKLDQNDVNFPTDRIRDKDVGEANSRVALGEEYNLKKPFERRQPWWHDDDVI